MNQQETINRLTRELAETRAELSEASQARLNQAGRDTVIFSIATAEVLLAERDILRSQLEQSHREAAAMREALEFCAGVFRGYVLIHAGKGTPDGDEKARRNKEFSEKCVAALSTSAGKGFVRREVLERAAHAMHWHGWHQHTDPHCMERRAYDTAQAELAK